MRVRRKHSREFKVETVKLVRERGVPMAQAARDLDLSVTLVRKWVRQFAADPKYAFPGLGQQKPEDAELTQLRREVARLKMERDLQKNCPAAWTAPSVGPETPPRIDSCTEWRGRSLFGGRQARKKTWSGGGCGLASGDALSGDPV